jgi:hypothetical protein
MPISNIETCDLIWEKALKLQPSYQIARDLSLDVTDVIDVIQSYRIALDKKVQDNPDLLDRKLSHIMATLDELNLVKKEAWIVYNATPIDNTNSRAKLLKLVTEVESQRSQVLQLLGSDKDAITRLQLAQSTQNQFINIVKGVVSGCPKCLDGLKRSLQSGRMKIVVEDTRPVNVVEQELVNALPAETE